jgi:hypothetical protein
MSTVTPEQKSSAIKTLAIIGFIAAIVAGLWISVQIVRHIPSAFSSLASIADSLYGNPKSMQIAAESDVVNSGEAYRFTFTPMRGEGSYAFTYTCVEGIAAETRDASGAIVRIACDEEVDIASGRLIGTQGAEVLFTSEKQRFTDVPFTLAFYTDGADEASNSTNGMVTVVNASIPERGAVAGAEDTKPEVVSKPTTPTTPAAPAPKPLTPGTTYVKKVPVTTTAYPTSNPKGMTDLELTLVTPSTMDAGSDETLQVIVKNIGTKTSEDWKISLDYPAMDDSFMSKSQEPLLPGERATMTIRFTATDDEGTDSVKARVLTSRDANTTNNSVTKTVKIKD